MRVTDRYTFFWRTAEPFSQWHPAGFTVAGVYFATAEHYMMHAKALLFGDAEAAQTVLEADHPRAVKAAGRRVRGFNEAIWVANRERIVREANEAKFRQNPQLLEALMATRGTELVEASPDDRVWGIGLDERDPRVLDPAQWRGLNLLGRTLTELRESLLAETEQEALRQRDTTQRS